MASIAGHQVDQAVTPVVGDPLSSAMLRALLNNTIDGYNAHDADPSIHILSGLASSRPAASAVPYNVYLSTDTLTLAYSDGFSWTPLNYTSANPVPNQADMMFLASTRR